MSFVSYSVNPSSNGSSVRREIERLLQDVSTIGNSAAWAPAANGYENANGFVMEFDVPGFALDQLDVTAQDGILIVSGKRNNQEKSQNTRALFVERPSSSFERRIRLPKTADLANISATHSNGVLTVNVAKLAVVAPRKISISAATPVSASVANEQVANEQVANQQLAK